MCHSVASLRIVLQDVPGTSSTVPYEEEELKDLSVLTQGYRRVLEDLERLMEKNKSLGSASIKISQKIDKNWQKGQWDQDVINELRDRIVSSLTSLNTFNARVAKSV